MKMIKTSEKEMLKNVRPDALPQRRRNATNGRKIYISLPVSGREDEARARAAEYKKRLKAEGWTPVSPFDIFAGKDPSWADHIAFDVRTLLHCDAMFCSWDSSDSPGCRVEHCAVMNWNERTKTHGGEPIRIIYEMSAEGSDR